MAKKFVLKLKEIKDIELEDEAGTKMVCSMKELTGTKRDEYLNKMSAGAELDENGKPLRMDFTNLQAQLISLSLYNDKGQNIPVMAIQSWPSSVVEELFNMAQELSALGKASAEALKKAKNVSQVSDSVGSR